LGSPDLFLHLLAQCKKAAASLTPLEQSFTVDNRLMKKTSKGGSKKVLKVLVKKGGDPNACLLTAAKHHPQLVPWLISRGATIRRANKKTGDTCLHVASRNRNQGLALEMLELLKNERNGEHNSSQQFVDRPNSNGDTPLILAAEQGLMETITALLQIGANPEASRYGYIEIYIFHTQ